MTDKITIIVPYQEDLVCEYAKTNDSNTTILVCKPAPQKPIDTYVPPEKKCRVDNCNQEPVYDPCKPYYGNAENVPMIACSRPKERRDK